MNSDWQNDQLRLMLRFTVRTEKEEPLILVGWALTDLDGYFLTETMYIITILFFVLFFTELFIPT